MTERDTRTRPERRSLRQVMTAAAAIDAALGEIDATADLDPASLDEMSPARLRALLASMIEQARGIRAGLLSQPTR